MAQSPVNNVVLLHTMLLVTKTSTNISVLFLCIMEHGHSYLQSPGICTDFQKLIDRLDESLIVVIAHALDILVMLLYPSFQELKKLILLGLIVDSSGRIQIWDSGTVRASSHTNWLAPIAINLTEALHLAAPHLTQAQ